MENVVSIIKFIEGALVYLVIIFAMTTTITFFIRTFIEIVSDILFETTDLKRAYTLVSENQKLKKRNEKLEKVLEEIGYKMYE